MELRGASQDNVPVVYQLPAPVMNRYLRPAYVMPAIYLHRDPLDFREGETQPRRFGRAFDHGGKQRECGTRRGAA